MVHRITERYVAIREARRSGYADRVRCPGSKRGEKKNKLQNTIDSTIPVTITRNHVGVTHVSAYALKESEKTNSL